MGVDGTARLWSARGPMRALVAVLVLVLSSRLAAAQAPAAGDPPAVKLSVGETADVCRLARCPASAVFCDDPSLVRIEHAAGTIRLRAEKAGTTLCAVQQADTTRRVVKLVVEATKPKPSRP